MAPKPSNQMDSSWSWVILACCCLCIYFFSLLATSMGMIQVEMIDDLKFGSGAISIMTAFAVGWSTLLGPLSGAIASVLSMRFTVILGTVVMSFGMLLTAFSHSLPALLFFCGIITGLGHGIAYSPCFVIIQHHFKKRLILANGIMLSSSSFAMLSLPYLHRYIIDEYGWRFCFALNAALLLHIVVFASFFQPTPLEKMSMTSLSSCCSREGDASKNGSEFDDNDLKIDDKNDIDDNNEASDDKKEQEKMLFLSKESFHSDTYSKKMSMIIKSTDSIGSKTLPTNGGSRPYVPIYINGTPKLRSPVSNLIAVHSPLLRRSFNLDDDMRQRSISQISSISALSLDERPPTPSCPTPDPASTTTAIVTSAPAPLKSLSPLTPHTFGQLRKGSHSHLGSSLAFASSDLGSSIMLRVAIEEMKDEKDDFEYETFSSKIKRIVLCKPLWLLCINSLFFMCGSGTHSVHLPAYVESHGIPSRLIANIYTVYGVVIAIGRIGGGALYSRIKPPLIPLLFVLQVFNGLCLLLAPFYATNIAGVFIMEIGIGLTYGQSYMIQSPIAAQMFQVQDIPIAFGFIQLFNGMGYIGAPILAGYLYDATGTYDIPMHIAGCFVSGGSLSLLMMLWITRKDKKGDGEASQTDDEEKGKTRALIGGGDEKETV